MPGKVRMERIRIKLFWAKEFWLQVFQINILINVERYIGHRRKEVLWVRLS